MFDFLLRKRQEAVDFMREIVEGGLRERGIFHRDVPIAAWNNAVLPVGTAVQLWVPYDDSFNVYIIYHGTLLEISSAYFDHFESLSTFLTASNGIEGFERHEKLGSGAFGEVVHVTHPKTPGLHYAMKTVYAGVSGMAVLNEMINPDTFGHLLHVTETVVNYAKDGDIRMVMLPMANNNHLGQRLRELSQLLDNTASASEAAAIQTRIFQWMLCLTKTLAKVHEKGYAHADIKPENILVHNDIVIYADFGHSKLRVSRYPDRPGLTSIGSAEEWAPVPPSESELAVKFACPCRCGLAQLLPTAEPGSPLKPDRRNTMNSLLGLGEMSGDVFNLGWIIYEMLLIATRSSICGVKLPCRPTMKIFAWSYRPTFLAFVDSIVALPPSTPPSSELSVDPEGLAKDILRLVAHNMVVPRAIQRESSAEVASSIEEAMISRGQPPACNCSKDGILISKVW